MLNFVLLIIDSVSKNSRQLDNYHEKYMCSSNICLQYKRIYVCGINFIAFLPVLLVRQNCRMIRISRLVGRLCRQFPRLGSVEEAKRKQSLGTRNILYQARGQPGFVKIIQNKIT